METRRVGIQIGADRVVLVPNPAGRISSAEMVEQMRLAAPLASISRSAR